jgi:transcriptional regulator with XRE-family HTH domain
MQAGLSQRSLAGLVHRRASSISAWECGQRLPSVDSLFLLARSLDTLTEALYWDLYTAAKKEAGRTEPGT